LRFTSILFSLPYPEFSFREQGIQSGYISFDPPYLAMVHQLFGGKAKAEIEKLLARFFQLLFQVVGG
jgi:hypothetical protein